MRLICPNCDAQYEVPDEVIPAEGRDVQCSNCGNTWFQHHPDQAPADARLEADEEDVATELPDETDAPAEDEELIETPADAPQRREMDPSVEDILRQEAERETAAREAEALETQPDLGLTEVEDEAEKRAREARERMARMRGEEPEDTAPDAAPHTGDTSVQDPDGISDAAATAAAVGSRRELLPDIEEINSTLRSTGDRQVAGDDLDPNAPVRQRKKRGFRRGFALMVLLFAVAIAIYVMAPRIAQTVPQVDPWLSGYVTWVDGLRQWLDGHVQTWLKWLDETAAQSSGSGGSDQ